ncbi:MAG: hypothetical protein HGA93_04065, partial [Methanothrix sp.]|nr:hypothetical protein [Methanothrix sp.]
MPHICTRCGNTFESGEDILKGCPACDRFQSSPRRALSLVLSLCSAKYGYGRGVDRGIGGNGLRQSVDRACLIAGIAISGCEHRCDCDRTWTFDRGRGYIETCLLSQSAKILDIALHIASESRRRN